MKTRLLIALIVVLLLSIALIDHSPAAKAAPLDLSGEIHGAPYRIRVPEVWNGTLLIFAHGYRDKADHPGEIDNRNADVAPSAALEAPLLAQGFALAGTAYKDNGWAIGDAIQDVKNLGVFFRENVAQPQRTIIVAASLGTFVGYKSMEQFNGIYDGALCLCSAGAGATRLWDSGVPLYLAYDVVFGIPPSWGTVAKYETISTSTLKYSPSSHPSSATSQTFRSLNSFDSSRRTLAAASIRRHRRNSSPAGH